MTKPINISPIWMGETVAVLASGPKMNIKVAEQLRKYKCIVVNHTHKLAPWADMMVAADVNLPLWNSASDFKGIKICCTNSEKIDAFCPGSMFEKVKIGPMHEVEIQNSGLIALRIAGMLGAKKIILAGFNPDLPGHFEGRPNDKMTGKKQHDAVEIGLKKIVKELLNSGIEIEFYVQKEDEPILKQVSKRKKKNVRS